MATLTSGGVTVDSLRGKPPMPEPITTKIFQSDRDDTPEVLYGSWEDYYPCEDECGFIRPPNAFDNGNCYLPCLRCGGRTSSMKAGREVYVRKPWFFGMLTYKDVIRVELRGESS